MRFLLYNIRYGTGCRRPLFPWSGYLGSTTRNLQDIIRFIEPLHPDIIGLIEVDAGSFRTRSRNQAQVMADALGHYTIYRSKYGRFSPVNAVPILNKQGNAFLTRDTIHNGQFHYFDRGTKRLVIELELENLTVFLVHLALSFRARHDQLSELYSLVKSCTKPHIVAGDFNTAWGDREIHLFLAATGLTKAGPDDVATFPSWSPKRQLDFILYSRGIRVTRFMAPWVQYSDHLPLVCDFDVEGKAPA